MPTVLRENGFRFFFYSNEAGEPPHIHVEKEGKVAKFWLEPVELARTNGFKSHELTTIRDLILDRRNQLKDSWHEFFKEVDNR